MVATIAKSILYTNDGAIATVDIVDESATFNETVTLYEGTERWTITQIFCFIHNHGAGILRVGVLLPGGTSTDFIWYKSGTGNQDTNETLRTQLPTFPTGFPLSVNAVSGASSQSVKLAITLAFPDRAKTGGTQILVEEQSSPGGYYG